MKQEMPAREMTFKEIRKGNYLYVDKTEYIYDLLEANPVRCCFLSRPRRFGKTLLLSTFEELFQGDSELFRGLSIYKKGYKFESHPVLNFNMAYPDISSKDDLVSGIKANLLKKANDEGVRLFSRSYGKMLGDLLEGIHEKHGTEAVILVDEYDAPVTDHMFDRDLALSVREVQNGFFRAMKTYNRHVHFLIITGVTRYGVTFYGTGPNHLMDISLKPRFAGICGFTSSEIGKYFKGMFKDTIASLKLSGELGPGAGSEEMMALILKHYGGYNWLGSENILNPYSILEFFKRKKPGTYWPLKGRPSCLDNLVSDEPMFFIQPSLKSHSKHHVVYPGDFNTDAVPFLFHSGYLTVDQEIDLKISLNKDSETISGFTFRFPNTEVSQAYHHAVFNDVFGPDDESIQNLKIKFPNVAEQKKSGEAARLLGDILVSISKHESLSGRRNFMSGHLSTFDQERRTDLYFRAVLYCCFRSAGFDVRLGGESWLDRDDIVLSLNDKFRVVILMKYCCHDMMPTEEGDFGNAGGESECSSGVAAEMLLALDIAEKQMRKTDCAGHHRTAGCDVTCMAVALRKRNQVAVRFFEY
ncbi:MAG: AAA family ATPase [Deltaproteobacteria bacterium]|nr:AAA family ATPase [Deltaproteobacteria bacterium]